ncbi:uroporphyrin-III C-methyltransferase [Weizmannia acidilactici]|uniref:Uroporphyrinogen-III C-methyltransferase n=1 Tax=Weizmannia acidilactici TaxID=2607726 RepID=A0A5J4JFB5_9BACI|nr:uroporphyrinogen-III C-methyltransferase [Weizmannia acidilactici]GER66886.1 uroporphyrin-III C-methyltransferase [Weizmannia acidilactici]GER70139.1 uroporphyrin-III C-methyltransferase [Weizmannia acidilactici]GER74799.1 uroporphyrin-III C-methyltransferase [Weizmannia acidilactici]
MRKVYLVGAGPGDPELITVKGLRAIREAEVILYDRLVNPELLKEAKKDAELIYCGKKPNAHMMTQEMINHLLCHFANQGKTVVRLKGGDPFIFGRGGEEAQSLVKKHIPFEIVPGITAGSAAPAYAGIPLTHRSLSASVAFVAGVSKEGGDLDAYWSKYAGIDTLCIYMGVKNLPLICAQLIKHGKPAGTPAALIHWGTTKKQETVTGTLENISEKAAALRNPSLLIIGEVVKLRSELKWFEHQAAAVYTG